MRYLVLGSEGQIGADLVQHFKEMKEQVATFDIVECPAMDLRIPGAVDSYIKNTDFVFFLAYDVGGANYLKLRQGTYEFVDNNVRIMQNTFAALEKHKTPFIFASSQMSNMTYSSYGVLKAIGEYYTKALGGLTVKFWNVYGLEHDPAKTHVITDFVSKALSTGKIPMQTDGREERQFLYSRDCSKALHTLAQNYDRIPRQQELHITSFVWSSILDIARIVADLVGKVEIVPANTTDAVQLAKRNEPDRYILNWWQPTTSLSDGIGEIARHLRKS
jgi:nucleoside-diphosphate-sugar epimerase